MTSPTHVILSALKPVILNSFQDLMETLRKIPGQARNDNTYVQKSVILSKPTFVILPHSSLVILNSFQDLMKSGTRFRVKPGMTMYI